MVLDARQRLVLAEVGYGFLLTTFAVGGLLGTFDLGGAGLGSLLGGTLARVWGLTAPFWIAAAVMTLIAAAWRPMSQASAA